MTAERLTERQLLGIDCARCGAYLGVHARRLGEVRDRGYVLQLFGCEPRCPPDPLADSYDASTATVRRVAAGLRALR
ncbi:hypothetical protein [Streptomyces sp. B6B3]|uniref:hypothetical protein n=1 Tax=Streptomyces sp. B6B3 TaxID=3153570 RepID=UPI00325C8CDD